MRRALDAWNRHDLEGLLALCAPGVRFRSLIGAVEGSKAHRGHEGVRRWWDEVEEVVRGPPAWRSTRSPPAASGWCSTASGSAPGRASGAEVRWPFVGVARIADGLLSEWRLFAEPDEAEAFLGDAA